ncbi:MAG: DNA translocase FtsK 4TM domain-containing protein, partial [Myxococcota bacterium]|nr:DNA translocase FtsK 4TM domain-containing protein [Myxococcota bacterium]
MARTRTRSTSAKAENPSERPSKSRAKRKARTSASRRASGGSQATGSMSAPLVPPRVRQLALIGVLLGSAYSTVALASWRATDPAFTTTGMGVVGNAAGAVGAYVADGLFHVFGHGAWTIAVVGLFAGLKVAGRRLGGWIRMLAGAALMWTGQTALALLHPAGEDAAGFPAGGLIGEGSAQTLLELVGPAGAWIVLLGVAMVGASYATQLDWGRVFGFALVRAEDALPVVGRIGKMVGAGAVGRVRQAGAAMADGLWARPLEEEPERHSHWDDRPASAYEWDDPEPSFPSADADGLHPDTVGMEGAAGVPGAAVDFQREPDVGRPAAAPVPLPRPVELGIPGPAAFEPNYADAVEDRTQVASRSLVEVEWESTQHTGVAGPAARAAWDTPERAPITPAPRTAVPVMDPDDGPAVPHSAADGPPRRTIGPGAWPPAVRPSVDEAAASNAPEPVQQAATDEDRISQALDAPLRPSQAPAVSDASVDAAHAGPPASASGGAGPTAGDAPAASAVPTADAGAPEPVARPSDAFAGDLPPLAAQDPPSPRLRATLRRAGAIHVDPDALVSGGSDAGGKVVIESGDDVDFELPHLGLLDSHERSVARIDENALRVLGDTLESKLNDFGVKGEVVAIRPGPVITTFEYLPAPGIKLSKITALQDDIAMALKALRVRIVAPIPGRGVVGFEVPNKKRQVVWVRDMLASESFRSGKRALPMLLGKNVEGKPEIGDLAKAP